MRLINPIIPGEYRYPTITPFTIPDGHTYLKTLERLVKTMKTLIDSINENNEEMQTFVVELINNKIEEINTAFTEFEGEVDDKIASVDTKITELETFVNTEISTLVTYVNDSVQQIINSSIEVQDPVVASIVRDSDSESRAELDSRYLNIAYQGRNQSIMANGAVGDGVTDDTDKVNEAIENIRLGGWKSAAVEMTGDHLITEVNVTTPHIRIVGDGSIVNGTIKLGEDGSAPPYTHLFTRIEGLRFTRDEFSSTISAITAARAYSIEVFDCEFDGYKSAFEVREQAFSDSSTLHVARVNLSRLQTRDVMYVVKVNPYTAGGGLLVAADISLTDSNFLMVKDTHVHAEGVDGLLIANNIMFMPSYHVMDQVKRWNIRVDGGHQIEIVGNHLFEAGLESIHLSRVQMVGIDSNTIHTPGQKSYADAIRFTGGDSSGTEYVIGSVTSNKILFPTRHGISIEGNSGHIAVDNNVVRSPGNLSRFYGSGTPPVADYVSTSETARNVIVGSGGVNSGSVNSRLVVRGQNSVAQAGAASTISINSAQPTSSHNNWNTFQVSEAYPSGNRLLSTGTQNAFVTYDVELQPGTWKLRLIHQRDSDRGIYDVRVNNETVGTIDGHGTAGWVSNEIEDIEIPVGGNVTVSLVMSTKSEASSGYRGSIASLHMTKM